MPAQVGRQCLGSLLVGVRRHHQESLSVQPAEAIGVAVKDGAVTLTGQAGFTKSGDTCTGTSLGPGQSCTVSVQFTPASYAPVSATLTAARSVSIA